MRKITMAFACLLMAAAAFAASSAYKDGNYSGTYDAMDGHGWKPQMTVAVRGGRISAVAFDSVNKVGQLKTKDAAYSKAMKGQTGTSPDRAYPELARRLVAKQEAGVDAVSGATGSSDNFNALAAAILQKAKKGDASPTVLPMNDAYKAEDKIDTFGYKGVISISFQDGKIVKVVYDEVDKNGKSKKTNADYAKNMKAQSKVTPEEAMDKLAQSLLAKQDPAEVDAVSGATSMSHRFVALVELVLAMR